MAAKQAETTEAQSKTTIFTCLLISFDGTSVRLHKRRQIIQAKVCGKLDYQQFIGMFVVARCKITTICSQGVMQEVYYCDQIEIADRLPYFCSNAVIKRNVDGGDKFILATSAKSSIKMTTVDGTETTVQSVQSDYFGDFDCDFSQFGLSTIHGARIVVEFLFSKNAITVVAVRPDVPGQHLTIEYVTDASPAAEQNKEDELEEAPKRQSEDTPSKENFKYDNTDGNHDSKPQANERQAKKRGDRKQYEDAQSEEHHRKDKQDLEPRTSSRRDLSPVSSRTSPIWIVAVADYEDIMLGLPVQNSVFPGCYAITKDLFRRYRSACTAHELRISPGDFLHVIGTQVNFMSIEGLNVHVTVQEILKVCRLDKPTPYGHFDVPLEVAGYCSKVSVLVEEKIMVWMNFQCSSWDCEELGVQTFDGHKTALLLRTESGIKVLGDGCLSYALRTIETSMLTDCADVPFSLPCEVHTTILLASDPAIVYSLDTTYPYYQKLDEFIMKLRGLSNKWLREEE